MWGTRISAGGVCAANRCCKSIDQSGSIDRPTDRDRPRPYVLNSQFALCLRSLTTCPAASATLPRPLSHLRPRPPRRLMLSRFFSVSPYFALPPSMSTSALPTLSSLSRFFLFLVQVTHHLLSVTHPVVRVRRSSPRRVRRLEGRARPWQRERGVQYSGRFWVSEMFAFACCFTLPLSKGIVVTPITVLESSVSQTPKPMESISQPASQPASQSGACAWSVGD